MIATMRRFGDKVRVAPNGHGERTGSAPQGRVGLICDTLPDAQLAGERYWVRFDRFGFEIFYDWILAHDLRDY